MKIKSDLKYFFTSVPEGRLIRDSICKNYNYTDNSDLNLGVTITKEDFSVTVVLEFLKGQYKSAKIKETVDIARRKVTVNVISDMGEL